MVVINDVDLFILKTLNDLKKGELVTTWGMTKKIYYKNTSVSQDNICHNAIISRLKKLTRYGLILKIKNSKISYNLIEDYVKFGYKKFPDSKQHYCVSLFMNGKWSVFQL